MLLMAFVVPFVVPVLGCSIQTLCCIYLAKAVGAWVKRWRRSDLDVFAAARYIIPAIIWSTQVHDSLTLQQNNIFLYFCYQR